MSSKDDLNNQEQGRRPEKRRRHRRKKASRRWAPDEVSTEDETPPTPPIRINSRASDPSPTTHEQHFKQFDVEHEGIRTKSSLVATTRHLASNASEGARLSSPRASVPRPNPSEEITNVGDTEVISPQSVVSLNDEGGHNRGFLRRAKIDEIIRSIERAITSSGSNSGHEAVAVVGGDDENEESIVDSSVNVMTQAQLVNDPVAEVGRDRTEELELEISRVQNNKKVQMLVGAGIVLVLVAVIVTSVSIASDNRNSPAAISSIPTSMPTQSPASEQEEAWITLIQSRMPTITFDDVMSPQRQALDWMLQDSYTVELNDNDRIIQRYALAVLYYSTNGPTSWNSVSRNGWLSSSRECFWGKPRKGRLCTDKNVVNYLSLDSSGLSGTLPRAVGLLSALTGLSLGNNSLEGTIPSEVGLLSSLTFVDLSGNSLEGTIPYEVGFLSSLEKLSLLSNNLQGTIPSQVLLLKNLTWLDLAENNLEGTIPSQIGSLSFLSDLFLFENKLEGTIPSEVGLLSSLLSLLLFRNNLEGTIPSRVWLLQHLTALALFDNNLEGTIPSTIGLLSSLTLLNGWGNHLEGTIPTEIGLLSALSLLYLHSNHKLSGRLPTELARLSNLDYLDLSSTNVSGSIPSRLCVTLERASIDCGEMGCDCCVGPPLNYTPC